MIRSNGSTVMELPDMTSGIPLVLPRSIKIRPGGNLEDPLECTRLLTNQMDIKIDTGFHHKNPNVYFMLTQVWGQPRVRQNTKWVADLDYLKIFSQLTGGGGTWAQGSSPGLVKNK